MPILIQKAAWALIDRQDTVLALRICWMATSGQLEPLSRDRRNVTWRVGQRGSMRRRPGQCHPRKNARNSAAGSGRLMR